MLPLIVLVFAPPGAPSESVPAWIAEVAYQQRLRAVSRHPDHFRALDWLRWRSKYIVAEIQAKRYHPRGVWMKEWHDDGHLHFMRQFREAFPALSGQVHLYAEWHQGFLLYEAERRGLIEPQPVQ